MRTVEQEQVATAELGLPPSVQAALGELVNAVAVAHEILDATWIMLSTGEIYREQGATIISERDADNARRRAIRQLERLGHKVTLQPLPEAA